MENENEKQLLEEIRELRIRLAEAEETISAIRGGGVDAIVVSGSQGEQVFTLTGAERAYRVLIETMNEGAASLNREGLIVYCNQRLSEMLKTPLGKVIGAPMRQFIRASDLPVFDSLMGKGVQESGKGEVALINSNGTPLSVLLSVSSMQRDNENICGITVTDLTVHKHIEEELRRHQDHLEELVKNRTSELETANRLLQEEITEHRKVELQLLQSQKMEAVGQLAGGVAHDFNNILSAIFGYSDLILNIVKDNDPVKNYVEEIMGASKRAAVLTSNLLSFSRKQTVSLAVIDLCEVIKSNEAFLRRLIREDIELKITCTGEPLTVLADRGQIEQVIMNLVANARDAMPKGGKLVVETLPVTLNQEFIKTHGYGRAGDYVMLSIFDSGVGMDKETQLRIFEPFFTTKEPGQGTGLGLSMVYGIVKKHDGFINVYSEPGTGTVFEIHLPRVQASAAPVGENKVQEAVPLRGGNETILVGEDDEALRRLSRNVLGHYGYQVIEAVDGQDAVDKFVEYGKNIDLVILDAIMPKKNGRLACDEMRSIRPDLKVIFVSGYTKDIFAQGNVFDDNSVFIQKPVSPDVLLAKVREMLDRRISIGDPN